MNRLAATKTSVTLVAEEFLLKTANGEEEGEAIGAGTQVVFLESGFVQSIRRERPAALPRLWSALQAASTTTSTNLVSLDLSWNALDDAQDVLAVGRLLRTRLQSLDLANCLSSDSNHRQLAMRVLGEALAGNRTLRRLNLGRNELDDEDVRVLCTSGLASNSHLRELNLFRNQIGDTGVACLLGALNSRNNSGLMHVDLVMNANVSRRMLRRLDAQLQRTGATNAVLAVCSAVRHGSSSALHRLPPELARMLLPMLMLLNDEDDDGDGDGDSEDDDDDDHFDTSSFDHDDCRRDFDSHQAAPAVPVPAATAADL